MNTSFKTILAIIDRVVVSATITNTLFRESDDISDEDRQALETWAGKPLEQVRAILTPIYGKRHIASDPFADKSNTLTAALVFWRYEDQLTPDIFYSVENSDYGQIIIASTTKGVCYLVFFSGDEAKVPGILQKEFPGSAIVKEKNGHIRSALDYLLGQPTGQVHLHIKGAADHLPIWQALTRVPAGKLVSYGTLAKATHRMAQDIGVAMGDNRLAILIPCHRVIKSTGELGQYHWGAKRKQAMIIKEAVV